MNNDKQNLADLIGNVTYSMQALKDVDDPFSHSVFELTTLPVDAHWSFEKMAMLNGYEVENHYVTTTDGYINHMHRLYKTNSFTTHINESGETTT